MGNETNRTAEAVVQSNDLKQVNFLMRDEERGVDNVIKRLAELH
ncbi:MAG: hypothetical protein PWQ55_1224 [Chloroflexota bacterium]|nr:hypothetical protein [Chloroflexota bacterium]